MAKILITGAAGFIGFHLSKRLLERGDSVVGLDNINDYYDPKLKIDRLNQLKPSSCFRFVRYDLENSEKIAELFKQEQFDTVLHMGAQAGVRYSIQNPFAYIQSNVVGFLNILEGCRHNSVKHLVYASSSSVYGANTTMPFSVHHNVDHPLSLYAATKKSNELMAHTYSSLYGIPCTGLRFFTVYGPWGRPDMAPMLFAKAIFDSKPIDVYNHGKMQRDFTYIDDIVEGVIRVCNKIPATNPVWNSDSPTPGSSFAPYKIYNIGNNNPVELLYFIEIMEHSIGKSAIKNLLPMQAGDVVATFADVDDLARDVGFKPSTSIETGVAKFVDWYRNYYKA